MSDPGPRSYWPPFRSGHPHASPRDPATPRGRVRRPAGRHRGWHPPSIDHAVRPSLDRPALWPTRARIRGVVVAPTGRVVRGPLVVRRSGLRGRTDGRCPGHAGCALRPSPSCHHLLMVGSAPPGPGTGQGDASGHSPPGLLPGPGPKRRSAGPALSGAFDHNAPSLGTSRAVGYVDNGEQRAARRDGVGRQINLRIDRQRWSTARRDDFALSGLEGCLEMFVGTRRVRASLRRLRLCPSRARCRDNERGRLFRRAGVRVTRARRS